MVKKLRARLERYDIVSRESREDLFGGEELAAANKLGGAICDGKFAFATCFLFRFGV